MEGGRPEWQSTQMNLYLFLGIIFALTLAERQSKIVDPGRTQGGLVRPGGRHTVGLVE